MDLSQYRTLFTHAGTSASTFIATLLWTVSNKSDLYALFDQLNVVIAEIAKFGTMATAIASAVYAIFKSSNPNKIADLKADATPQVVRLLTAVVNAQPNVVGVLTTNDVAGRALANSIPAATVVPSGTPQAAKLANGGL